MTWYKLVKYFRGGSHTYQIQVPKGVRLSKEDWDEIMEWVGEHTEGGHSAGYRISRTRLRKKSPVFEVKSYPADLCESLMGHGQKVTTTREMI